MTKKMMTFEQMATDRLAEIHTIMARYVKAGIVMVPSFAAAGLQFEPKEFHDAARLLGWMEVQVTIAGNEYWGYRGGK